MQAGAVAFLGYLPTAVRSGIERSAPLISSVAPKLYLEDFAHGVWEFSSLGLWALGVRGLGGQLQRSSLSGKAATATISPDLPWRGLQS